MRPRRSDDSFLRDFLVVDHESEGHPTRARLLNRKVMRSVASGFLGITKYVATARRWISSPPEGSISGRARR